LVIFYGSTSLKFSSVIQKVVGFYIQPIKTELTVAVDSTPHQKI